LLLGDLDKTPRSPVIKKVNRSEIDNIKSKQKEDANMFQVSKPIHLEEFDIQMKNSVKNTDYVTVQGYEEQSSPVGIEGGYVIEERQDKFVKQIWGEIYKIYGKCSPNMVKNLEVWAELVHRFLDLLLSGDWANVKVKGQIANNLIKHKLPRALFKGKGRINEKEAMVIEDLKKMDVDLKENLKKKTDEYKPPVGRGQIR
jgi:hypothetical protein